MSSIGILSGFSKASVSLAMALVLVAAGAARAAWDEPIDVSGPGVGNAVSLAIDGKGRAALLWSEWDGSHYRLIASLRPPGGDFDGGTAISPSDVSASNWSIAASKKGHLDVAMITSPDGGYFTAQVASAAPGALSFQAPVAVTPADQGPQGPQIVLDKKGGAVLVYEDGAHSYKPMAVMRPAGGSFGTPEQIDAGYGGGTSVSMDEKGNAVAYWHDGSLNIKAAIRPAGGSFGAAEQVNDPMGGGGFPSGAIDKKGNMIVAWSGRAVTRAAGDASFSAPFATSFDQGVKLTYDKKSNVFAYWSDNYNYVKRFAFQPHGGEFGIPTNLSTPTYSAGGGNLVLDKKGNARAVWIEYDGTHNRVWTALRPAGANFGTPEVLTPANVDSGYVHVELDRKGHATIAYVEVDEMSNSRVKVINESK